MNRNIRQADVEEYLRTRTTHYGPRNVGMDSTATASRKAACETITKLALEIQQEKTAAVAVDHKADDDALTNLVSMKPATRATAFEREARGQRVGLNDKLVDLRERLEIPDGQEQQQRDAIKDFWNGQHQRNTLNNDLKL